LSNFTLYGIVTLVILSLVVYVYLLLSFWLKDKHRLIIGIVIAVVHAAVIIISIFLRLWIFTFHFSVMFLIHSAALFFFRKKLVKRNNQ